MYVLFVDPSTQEVKRIFEKVTRIRPSQFDGHMLIEVHPKNCSLVKHYISFASLVGVEIQVMRDDFGLRRSDIA